MCKLWVIPEAVIMVETADAIAEPMMEAESNDDMTEMDDEEVMATKSVLDTPLTIEVGDEVKALARRLLGVQQ